MTRVEITPIELNLRLPYQTAYHTTPMERGECS